LRCSEQDHSDEQDQGEAEAPFQKAIPSIQVVEHLLLLVLSIDSKWIGNCDPLSFHLSAMLLAEEYPRC
jgi:hypothetical protein